MSPVQIRMARAALELSAEQLASKAAIGVEAVERLEQGNGSPDAEAKLRATLEGAGVEFLAQDGVKFHPVDLSAAASVPLDQLSSANDE